MAKRSSFQGELWSALLVSAGACVLFMADVESAKQAESAAAPAIAAPAEAEPSERPVNGPTPAAIDWIEDQREAERQARQQAKPILVLFHFEGCRGCKQLFDSIYADPRVITAINKSFVPCAIDVLQTNGDGRLLDIWAKAVHADRKPGSPYETQVVYRDGRWVFNCPSYLVVRENPATGKFHFCGPPAGRVHLAPPDSVANHLKTLTLLESKR